MPKFITQFDKRDRVHCEPGSRTKVMYGPIFDKNGVMSLKEIGTHDLYAEIQSHADSVDIHVLLQRYAQGDVGVFSRMQGAYGDFTQMPKTFAEALNTMIAAEQYFMGLPVETRAKFGHSFQQFLASMDGPDWMTDVGLVTPELTDVIPPGTSLPSQAAPSSVSASAPPPASPAVEG